MKTNSNIATLRKKSETARSISKSKKEAQRESVCVSGVGADYYKSKRLRRVSKNKSTSKEISNSFYSKGIYNVKENNSRNVSQGKNIYNRDSCINNGQNGEKPYDALKSTTNIDEGRDYSRNRQAKKFKKYKNFIKTNIQNVSVINDTTRNKNFKSKERSVSRVDHRIKPSIIISKKAEETKPQESRKQEARHRTKNENLSHSNASSIFKRKCSMMNDQFTNNASFVNNGGSSLLQYKKQSTIKIYPQPKHKKLKNKENFN